MNDNKWSKIKIIKFEYSLFINPSYTFTTAKTQMAHTVTAIAEEMALTLGGHNSPTNNHGTRFIPIPYENINPLVSTTVTHLSRTWNSFEVVFQNVTNKWCYNLTSFIQF